jgi:hypothetical protein
MKIMLCLMMLFLVFFTNACTNKSQPLTASTTPDIEGYITKAENQRILVVSPKAKDFSPTGGLKEFYDAVWVSNIPKDVKIGQKVQVWFEGAVAASYPGQAMANKISNLSSEKPFNAKLSEEQVIQQTLISQENSNIKVPVIKDVKFDSNTGAWAIRIKDGMLPEKESKEHILQIPDKITTTTETILGSLC